MNGPLAPLLPTYSLKRSLSHGWKFIKYVAGSSLVKFATSTIHTVHYYIHYIWIKTKNWREQKKAWLCERYSQSGKAARRSFGGGGVMAVRSPQSQIGDWNKKCYQISFLILFILWLTVSRQCYCFGKWWLVSGFGWKCHKKWQLALSELFTYGINHVGRRNPPEWLSAGDFQSFMIAFIKEEKQFEVHSY